MEKDELTMLTLPLHFTMTTRDSDMRYGGYSVVVVGSQSMRERMSENRHNRRGARLHKLPQIRVYSLHHNPVRVHDVPLLVSNPKLSDGWYYEL